MDEDDACCCTKTEHVSKCNERQLVLELQGMAPYEPSSPVYEPLATSVDKPSSPVSDSRALEKGSIKRLASRKRQRDIMMEPPFQETDSLTGQRLDKMQVSATPVTLRAGLE